MTSFQTRRNDETDEFVIVLDNLVPVAGLTMKRRGSVLSHQNLIENSQGLSGGGGGGNRPCSIKTEGNIPLFQG